MMLNLDMLVSESKRNCAECEAPLERGDVVWMRPVADKPSTVQICCATCVKRLALPMWDAEQQQRKDALRAVLDHDVRFS